MKSFNVITVSERTIGIRTSRPEDDDYSFVITSGFFLNDKMASVVFPGAGGDLEFDRLKNNYPADVTYKTDLLNDTWQGLVQCLDEKEQSEMPENPAHLAMLVFKSSQDERIKNPEFFYITKNKEGGVTSTTYKMNVQQDNVVFLGLGTGLNCIGGDLSKEIRPSHHYLSETIDRFAVNRYFLNAFIESENFKSLCATYDELESQILSSPDRNHDDVEKLENIRNHFCESNYRADLVIF